jgi:hypothetical protein
MSVAQHNTMDQQPPQITTMVSGMHAEQAMHLNTENFQGTVGDVRTSDTEWSEQTHPDDNSPQILHQKSIATQENFRFNPP